MRSIGVVCILMTVMSLLASGCAQYKKSGGKKLIKDCILPDDQKNSLQGHWTSKPIKFSFHNGDFGGGEINAIQAAAATWNDFFNASKAINPILDGGAKGTGNQSSLAQTVPSCTTASADGTVLYKRSNWNKGESAVAVTTFCINKSTSGGISTFANAIMEFNYQNFFVSNASGGLPDMQTIATHEMGHLLGLDHSCGTLQNGLDNAACPDPISDPQNPYLLAVMFPTVFFDSNLQGEVKTDLGDNDEGRANCLY